MGGGEDTNFSLCALYTFAVRPRCVLGTCFPMHLYGDSKPNPPASNFASSFLWEGPRSPPPTPASWPVCGPVSPLLVCRALGLGAGPSWSALQERGLLGDPQSSLGSGWRGGVGCGGGCGGWGVGVSQPTDENSKCSPAWAANRFQIGRVRARAAAAWLHKQPVAPDGGRLQPGEQVHGGLEGGWQQVEDPHPASLGQGGPCCCSSALP